MIVSRPIKGEKNCLLLGNEQKDLLIYDLGGELQLCLNPPYDGWCHDSLEHVDYYEYAPFGWDAYLGDKSNWIGGSEV